VRTESWTEQDWEKFRRTYRASLSAGPMVRGADCKTQADFDRAIVEAIALTAQLPYGCAEQKARQRQAVAMCVESNIRRLYLHRLSELADLPKARRDLVARMIEQSRTRQNEYLDWSRGLYPPTRSIFAASCRQIVRAIALSAWLLYELLCRQYQPDSNFGK
jgi:hypothetical protein